MNVPEQNSLQNPLNSPRNDDESTESSFSNPPSGPASALTSPSNSQIFDNNTTQPVDNGPIFFPPYSGPDINLQSKWRFWFESHKDTPALNTTNYLKQLRTSSSFRSLQQIYNFSIDNYNKFQRTLLFKEGIKPVWEDPHNFDGGRFFVHCQHEKQAFDNFLLVVKTILPGEIIEPDDLCGVLYAFKPPNRYSVSVWHKNSKDKPKIKEIRGHLKQLFGVKTVSYHNHRASIKLSHQPSIRSANADFGMSTYPPKKNQKKSADTLRFEASLNMLELPQVMVSTPMTSSSVGDVHKISDTKQRSTSFDFQNVNPINSNVPHSRSPKQPVSKSVNHSRKSSIDNSTQEKIPEKSPEKPKMLINEPFLNV